MNHGTTVKDCAWKHKSVGPNAFPTKHGKSMATMAPKREMVASTAGLAVRCLPHCIPQCWLFLLVSYQNPLSKKNPSKFWCAAHVVPMFTMLPNGVSDVPRPLAPEKRSGQTVRETCAIVVPLHPLATRVNCLICLDLRISLFYLRCTWGLFKQGDWIMYLEFARVISQCLPCRVMLLAHTMPCPQ